MNNFSNTNQLHFSVVSDPERAKAIWEYLSPHEEIDDEWNFRFAFSKYLRFTLHFIVGYHQNKPIGLLPLQWNTGKGPIPESYAYKKNFLEFFGGDDMDSNKVFTKPGFQLATSSFFKHIHSPAVLTPLAEPYIGKIYATEKYTAKYIVDLQKCSDFRDFMTQQFHGKARGKIVNQLNKLQRNHDIKVIDADADDLELLFDYNKERFGKSSSFHWEYRKQVFRDLLEQYDHDVFKVIIDGEPKAVSFSLLFKDTYLSMNIGYDYAIRDLGKFVVSTQFERAIKLKCKTYDGGKGDSGWKEQFHLQQIPQYKLTIPAITTPQSLYS